MRTAMKPDSIEEELIWIRQRLARLQETLREREKRLKYFLEEGVPDIIVRKALTNVEEAQAEIEELVNRRQILLSKQAFMGGYKLN